MNWFNICQKLSKEVYNDNVREEIDGWSIVKLTDNKSKKNVYCRENFVAVSYLKGKDIIIVFRGTDDNKDLVEDAKIIIGTKLKTDDYAHKYTEEIIAKYPGYKITFTGHSLGGAYAQLACVKKLISGTDCKALTFNAPGMNSYLKKKMYKGDFVPSKFENYVILNDFVGNYRGHIGYTYYFQPFPMDRIDKNNEQETPHGAILDYSPEELGGIVSKAFLTEFGSKNGLALWSWDEKNTADNKYKNIIKKPLRLSDLTAAIRIIKYCPQIKMNNNFVYVTKKGRYKLP